MVHQARRGAPTEVAMQFNQPGKRRWQNKRGEEEMQQQTSTREVQRKEKKKTQQERGGAKWCDKIIGRNYSTISRSKIDGGAMREIRNYKREVARNKRDCDSTTSLRQ